MDASEKFVVGNQYSRADIYRVLEVPLSQRRGNWETGYNQFEGEYYVFVNVKTPGRTGHEYNDAWMSNGSLLWHGKVNSHINQPSIKKMLDASTRCHFFTRDDNRNVYFTYQGVGKVVEYNDVIPVEVYWSFPSNDSYLDGTNVSVIRYSKRINRSHRISCISHYGDKCWACGFDFVEKYGTLGDGYIRVFYNNPEEIGNVEDPIRQLRPVCPNCLAMIQRRTSKIETIDGFREYLSKTTR